MPLPPHASRAQRAWHYGYLGICVLVFVFLVAPIFAIMPLSFNAEPYFTYPLAGFSLRWYEALLADDPQGVLWREAFYNSIVVGIASTALATVLGTAAALGLNRAQFRGKGAVLAVLISPMIVPIIITAVGVYYLYAQIGLAGTYTGIILSHTALGVPFVVITVLATLSGFDHTMVRAGQSLGAPALRVFFKVTLPLILPGVVSGALFAFVTSWDEIVVVLFMAGSDQHTIPRRMWSGIRELISPTIMSVAVILVVVSVLLMVSMELLRRRGERLRGIRP